MFEGVLEMAAGFGRFASILPRVPALAAETEGKKCKKTVSLAVLCVWPKGNEAW